MKKPLLFLIILICAVADSNAQYYTNRNKVWAFGQKAGLDFRSGVPVPIVTGITPGGLISEGCASVSDEKGQLLFYTDGKTVYNRKHTVMPSATSIVPFETFSTSQAAVIVPVLGQLNRYYLFSLEQSSSTQEVYCRLVYCIVDMTLDGGYGDIAGAVVNIPLADSLSEKIVPILGNNQNIWLVTHKRDAGIFFAYEITGAGIDTTPVVSAVGSFSGHYSYSHGVLKASPDGRKLVAQCMLTYASISKGTELYDFDPVTGIVSNCVVLATASMEYGAEFSPDNTKLYTQQSILDTSGNTIKIYQHNLASGSASAIISSKTLVATTIAAECSDLKLAPDHKIYFAGRDDSSLSHSLFTSRYMDCISKPNLPGTSCDYIPHAIKLHDSTGIIFGLPNVVMYTLVRISDVRDTKYFSDFSVYPNPATTELYVSATEKITQLSISNIAGQVVFTGKYNSELARVDIGMLPPNTYFVKVNEVEVQRFVKE